MDQERATLSSLPYQPCRQQLTKNDIRDLDDFHNSLAAYVRPHRRSAIHSQNNSSLFSTQAQSPSSRRAVQARAGPSRSRSDPFSHCLWCVALLPTLQRRTYRELAHTPRKKKSAVFQVTGRKTHSGFFMQDSSRGLHGQPFSSSLLEQEWIGRCEYSARPYSFTGSCPTAPRTTADCGGK